MTRLSIPVLYYHRVNRVDRRMAVSPERFSEQIKHLADKGWRSIGVSELIQFIETGKVDHPRPFLITFDDGYFDNWFHAFPVLKKNSMKTIVFMVTDWIDGPGPARPQNRDNAPEPTMRSLGRAIKAALRGDRADFLNQGEIKAMAESGLVEFGSHGSSHAPCFASHRIDQFLFTQSPHWTKAALARGDIRAGLPLYEWASSITVPCFRPSLELKEKLISHVQHQGGWEAGQSLKSQKKLMLLLRHWSEKILEGEPGGEYETPAEAEVRICSDLRSSRQRLEEVTGAPCLALSWPWGQHSRLGVKAAGLAGLKLAVTTRTGAVCRGDDRFRLDRLRVSGRTSGALLEKMMRALAHPLAARTVRRFSPAAATDRFIDERSGERTLFHRRHAAAVKG